MQLKLPDHPLLDVAAFITEYPQSLGDLPESQLSDMLRLNATAPLSSNDEVRLQVRNLLRQAGFKPTGRSKPASEYLIKAANNEALGSINLAVDACNVVSLHSGLPISVIDLDLAQPPLVIGVAEKGTSYVFNQSGQTIDVGLLLCLMDAAGPCANAVKDSHRTKTHDGTKRTLTVIWGTTALPGRSTETEKWYRSLLADRGAVTLDVRQERAASSE